MEMWPIIEEKNENGYEDSRNWIIYSSYYRRFCVKYSFQDLTGDRFLDILDERKKKQYQQKRRTYSEKTEPVVAIVYMLRRHGRRRVPTFMQKQNERTIEHPTLNSK